MRHGGAALAVAACLLASSAPSQARSFRQNEVPNGTLLGCDTCHIVPGGPLNAFGDDCEQSQEIPGDGASPVRWELIYNLDSDGDGWANGYELGDPDGQWRPFEPDPPYQSNPADPGSTPPGDPPDNDPMPEPEPDIGPEPEPEPEPEPDVGPEPEPAPDVGPEVGPAPDIAPDMPAPEQDADNGQDPDDAAGDADDGPGYILGPACATPAAAAPGAPWIWLVLIGAIFLRR